MLRRLKHPNARKTKKSSRIFSAGVVSTAKPRIISPPPLKKLPPLRQAEPTEGWTWTASRRASPPNRNPTSNSEVKECTNTKSPKTRSISKSSQKSGISIKRLNPQSSARKMALTAANSAPPSLLASPRNKGNKNHMRRSKRTKRQKCRFSPRK